MPHSGQSQSSLLSVVNQPDPCKLFISHQLLLSVCLPYALYSLISLTLMPRSMRSDSRSVAVMPPQKPYLSRVMPHSLHSHLIGHDKHILRRYACCTGLLDDQIVSSWSMQPQLPSHHHRKPDALCPCMMRSQSPVVKH